MCGKKEKRSERDIFLVNVVSLSRFPPIIRMKPLFPSSLYTTDERRDNNRNK